ncbi:MAG: DUF4124 domain-containing protein [Pseudomonadota bacterium]
MQRLLLLSLLIAFSPPALAVYKCEADGKVGYGDTPCPGGKTLDLRETVSSTPAAAAKQPVSRDKAELKRIDNERRRHEAREEQERKTAARILYARQKKCSSLALRTKAAGDHAALAAGKSADKSRLKARRAARAFDAECSNDTARPGMSYIGPRQ